MARQGRATAAKQNGEHGFVGLALPEDIFCRSLPVGQVPGPSGKVCAGSAELHSSEDFSRTQAPSTAERVESIVLYPHQHLVSTPPYLFYSSTCRPSACAYLMSVAEMRPHLVKGEPDRRVGVQLPWSPPLQYVLGNTDAEKARSAIAPSNRQTSPSGLLHRCMRLAPARQGPVEAMK